MKVKRLLVSILVMAVVLVFASCSSREEKKAKFFEKGEAFFEQGDLVKARLEFRNSLQVDPNFAEGYYMLGMVEVKDRNWNKAFGLISKAVQLDASLLDAQTTLGNLFLAANKIDEAMEKADLVLGEEPSHTGARLLRAGALMKEKKWQEAEAILKEIVDQDPGEENANILLAQARIGQENTAGAAQVLRKILEQNEENSRARLMLIRLLEQEGDMSAAESHYKTLIRLNPEQHEMKLMLAQFYAKADREDDAEALLAAHAADQPGDVTPRLYQAAYYKETASWAAMVEVLNEAIRDFPEAYEPYQMLAGHYVATGSPEEGIAVLERFMETVRTGPDYVKAKIAAAEVRHRQGRPEEGMRLVDEVLAENPKDLRAHTLKGDMLAMAGDYVEAIVEYRAVLEEEPNSPAVALKLAKAHLANNEPKLAEDTYKRLLAAGQKRIQARLGLATLYGMKPDLDATREQLEAVLEIDGDNSKAIMALGDLALGQKELEKAKGYYRQLLTLEPVSAQAYYKNGLIHGLEKDMEAARTFFEKALTAKPDYVPALKRLLQIVAAEEGLQAANKRCWKQISQRPDNPDLYVVLGSLNASAKDYDAALTNFNQALDIDPNHSSALFGLARLAQVQGSIDEALQKYQRLRKVNPDNTAMALVTAQLLDQTGKYREAKEIYEEVLEKDPTLWGAANNLAFYYAQHEPTADNLKTAEALMAPWLAEHKDDVNLMDTVAWIAYRQGNFERAKQLLLSIEAKVKDMPIIDYHLGMAYFQLGEKEKARHYLHSATDGAAAYPGLKEAQETLRKLE